MTNEEPPQDDVRTEMSDPTPESRAEAWGASYRSGEPIDFSAWHTERTQTGYTSPSPGYRVSPPPRLQGQGQPWVHDVNPAPATAAPAVGSRRGWIAPLIVLLAAVVAFSTVLYLTRGHDDAQADGMNTVAPQPSGGQAKQGTGNHADFPATAIDCNGVLGNSVRQDTSTTDTSCELLSNLGAATLDYVLDHPNATTFTIGGVRSPKAEREYSAACSRENHLTTCSGSGTKARYKYYVKDSA